VTEISPVNFNVPTKLLADFDAAWQGTGRIPSRTAALHKAMENFIEKHKKVKQAQET